MAGYVYFLEANDDAGRRVIKIGFSFCPLSRIESHKCSNPWVKVLAIVRGSYQDEQAYHRQWSHLHVVREWFLLAPDIEAWVNSLENIRPDEILPQRRPARPLSNAEIARKNWIDERRGRLLEEMLELVEPGDGELIDRSVCALPISSLQARNLARRGILRVRDIIACHEGELLETRHFGTVALAKVNASLGEVGLAIKPWGFN